MYAIFETGGKQYKVSEGDVVFVEKLNAQDGEEVSFDKVLAVGSGSDITVGTPVVDGAVVVGKVIKSGSQKIIVFKMKSKKGYRRKQGHRQPYTQVEISRIKA